MHTDEILLVIDRDFDGYLPHSSHPACVALTDHRCMEGYALEEETLSRILGIVANKPDLDGASLLKAMCPVLEELFLIRLTHASLSWDLDHLDPSACLTFAKPLTIKFDLASYTERQLNKNGRLPQKREFEIEASKLRSALAADIRDKAHGHDFAELLRWTLKKLNLRDLPDTPMLTRMLLLAVQCSLVREKSLFKRLIAQK